MNMAFYQKRGVIKVISGVQISYMQDLDINEAKKICINQYKLYCSNYDANII